MPTISHKIQALSKKQQQLQQLSDAYTEGITIARESRRQTLIECKRMALDQVLHPKTCRHPAARLSKETLLHNTACKSLARSIDKMIESEQIDREDDIPF